MRQHEDMFEEIKFRAALARTQWEALQEQARVFASCVQEARNSLAKINEAKVTALRSTDVDASSS